MGTSYFLYTEGLIQDKWVCLNYYLPVGDTYQITETYYNGSRTYFSAAYEKLCEIGQTANPDNLSPYLRDKAKKEYWGSVHVIDIESMQRCLPKSQQYELHGYVLKSQIFQIETDESEEIYEWLSPDEYASLSHEMQKCYQYYEWNDEMGWYRYFRLLLERVQWQKEDWTTLHRKPGSDIRGLRLVMMIS